MCIRDSRNIGHEVRVNGVTAVRAARVVEIYDGESRDFLVTVLVIQQVVVGDCRKIGKLVVIDVLGIAPVSYTQLDVYKRQFYSHLINLKQQMSLNVLRY